MRQNLEELVDSIEVIADNATKLANVVADTSEAGGRSSMQSVTALINSTVEQSYKSTEQINTSAELVFAASEQFNVIFESIESTNGIINDMIKSVYEASDVASNMAAITEEQSASAEEIEATAVSIQELSNTVLDNSANVQRDSKELASTAEILKEHISKFTIEKEEADFAEIQ